MQKLVFSLRNPDRRPGAALVPHRTVDEIMSNTKPPIAPGADPLGWYIDELGNAECRFPIGHDHGGHRFCAEVVADYRPGRSLGSYCGFHVNYLRRQPSVFDTEAA